MSCSSDWEAPHSIDIATKTTSEMANTRFVPNRSPIQPAAGMTAARPSR